VKPVSFLHKPDIIKDGIIAGLVGVVGDFLVHGSGYLIFGASMTAHYISQLIFPFQEVTVYRFAVGLVTHFFAGPFIGILLALIYRYTGNDYPYLKGIGLGVLFWIIHVAGIPNLVETRPFIFRDDIEVVVDLLAHILFGILAAFYLLRFTRHGHKA
jgi:hypothetical protein